MITNSILFLQALIVAPLGSKCQIIKAFPPRFLSTEGGRERSEKDFGESIRFYLEFRPSPAIEWLDKINFYSLL